MNQQCSCGHELNDHRMSGENDPVFGFPVHGLLHCRECPDCVAKWSLGPDALTPLMSGVIKWSGNE